MLTILSSEHRQLNSEAQAFLAEERGPSAIAQIIGLVAALDAACVVFALLAA